MINLQGFFYLFSSVYQITLFHETKFYRRMFAT